MFLEGGQQHLANEAWHLALLRCLHREDDADRFDRGGVVVIKGTRPPGRRHFRVPDFNLAEARGQAEAEHQLVVIVRLVPLLRDRLEPLFLGEILRHHLSDVLEFIGTGIEQPEARQGVRHEMVVQRLIAA